MTPRILLGTAIVPGGDEELRLFRRGDDFMIVLDRNELMNSRMSGSEEALAEMTIERLRGRPGRRRGWPRGGALPRPLQIAVRQGADAACPAKPPARTAGVPQALRGSL